MRFLKLSRFSTKKVVVAFFGVHWCSREATVLEEMCRREAAFGEKMCLREVVVLERNVPPRSGGFGKKMSRNILHYGFHFTRLPKYDHKFRVKKKINHFSLLCYPNIVTNSEFKGNEQISLFSYPNMITNSELNESDHISLFGYPNMITNLELKGNEHISLYSESSLGETTVTPRGNPQTSFL